MTFATHIPGVRQFEPVDYREWSHIVTPADFDGGCFIRTVNGREIGTGTNALGFEVSLPLNVPLCIGCDGEIVNHCCDACELVFSGEPE